MGDITVRAVFPHGGFGFDGQSRRRHGDIFTIDRSLFSENWMELVDGGVPETESDLAPGITAAAAKLAAETGFDISTVEGTGSNGNVTKGDVEAAIASADDWSE